MLEVLSVAVEISSGISPEIERKESSGGGVMVQATGRGRSSSRGAIYLALSIGTIVKL